MLTYQAWLLLATNLFGSFQWKIKPWLLGYYLLKKGHKKAKLIMGQKKPNFFVVLLFLCHKNTYITRISLEVEIKPSLALYRSSLLMLPGFSWFMRLHTLVTMVLQFAACRLWYTAIFCNYTKFISHTQNHKSVPTSSTSLSHSYRWPICQLWALLRAYNTLHSVACAFAVFKQKNYLEFLMPRILLTLECRRRVNTTFIRKNLQK